MPVLMMTDGFSISVMGGKYVHSYPKSTKGPYHSLELGYPSVREDMIMSYAEEPVNPTQTIYSYVPKNIVMAVLEKHGGVYGICRQGRVDRVPHDFYFDDLFD